MAVGNPVAVTLVEENTYGQICWAASYGWLDANGHRMAPAELFCILGLPAQSLAGDGLTIVIANGLDVPLESAGNYLPYAVQTHYPAMVDDLGPNLSPEQIPASRPHPVKPGVKLYGVGMYRLEGSSVFRAIDGVLAFSYRGAQTLLAVGFSAGGKHGGGFRVAADIPPAKNSNLLDFYNTVDSGSNQFTSGSVGSSTSGGVQIQAAYTSGDLHDVRWDLNPNRMFSPLVLTVAVSN